MNFWKFWRCKWFFVINLRQHKMNKMKYSMIYRHEYESKSCKKLINWILWKNCFLNEFDPFICEQRMVWAAAGDHGTIIIHFVLPCVPSARVLSPSESFLGWEAGRSGPAPMIYGKYYGQVGGCGVVCYNETNEFIQSRRTRRTNGTPHRYQ